MEVELLPQRKTDLTAPFQSINNTAYLTGFSRGYIRDGCKSGTIPHVMCGQEYRVNVPLFLQQLETESAASTKKTLTGGCSASEGGDRNGNGQLSLPFPILPQAYTPVKQKGVSGPELVR